ncbi:hypothetical protein HOY80DRAFT_880669 [Tuber brumale]|nr:hypothetical protein HOY80DRAFT_880669 [Tuber brumale]
MIMMNTEKVDSIKIWLLLKNIKNVLRFTGVENFYHHYREEFSNIAKLFTNLMKNNIKWR